MNQFTHLHLHTEYSLLDGFCPIQKLIERAKELDMTSIAITDHGCMFGVVEFYKKAVENGIKPIIGCEIYTTNTNYRNKDPNDRDFFHLVLLAENQLGYQNLLKIVSEGYVNGFYYKPRVDKTILKKYSEGIIALSACLGGEVQQRILENDIEKAKDVATELNHIFGEDQFFLELQDHRLPDQLKVNRVLKSLSEELSIPMVATNDVHYIRKEDATVHDVLLCIQTGTTVNEPNRMKFPNDEFYLKSYEEMNEIFSSTPEAILNTQRIADRCQVELDFSSLHLPEFHVPDGYTNQTYLRKLTMEGLHTKYATVTPEILERTETELGVIESMGFVDYFLIVWDFIRYAKEQHIAVGPGRGSAAGSIVSYALDITGIDPLKYQLLFERFLNAERISMPDIDIDFCYERRDEVIQYVVEKYGIERVAQIVTFGTMAARAAIRDVGRAMDMPYSSVDRIAKMIPAMLGITIEKALEINKDLMDETRSNEETHKLIEYAKAVEGLPRHTSTHAAGVVISKAPVTEYVPLSRSQDVITTQFNMIELEELGLLKMDFLGLRTLTVIQDAINIIKKTKGIDIDIDKIDENDPEVIDLFGRAETMGIFQFESAGMRAFLKELKATVFDDLIAANSLFRPGPMNEIPNYIKNKHFPQQTVYLHPKLEPILNVTYGTIVYQEQVMQIVQQLAGFSLGEADLLRRAMGKKKMDVMEREREKFLYGETDENGKVIIGGCIRNGIPIDAANQIYDLMIDFAKYAFNKSHSVAYAYVAVQTAWLKRYYPVEFMAALMSSVMGNSTQLALYIQETKRLGIRVLPPDINFSFKKFSVHENDIRFGLLAVKNVGQSLIDTLLQCRKEDGPFKDFIDFVQRMERKKKGVLNKRAIECLIRVGAFESLKVNRRSLVESYEKVIESILSKNKKNISGQMDMMGVFGVSTNVTIENVPEYPRDLKLRMEKELTGMYISDHPLKSYETAIQNQSNFSTAELADEDIDQLQKIYDHKRIQMVSIVSKRNDKRTRNNDFMTFLTLEDTVGMIEAIVFPKILSKYEQILREDAVLLFGGRLSISENEDPKLIVDTIREIKPDDKMLYVQLDSVQDTKGLDLLKEDLSVNHGDTRVVVYYLKEKQAVYTSEKYNVNMGKKGFLKDLQEKYGSENIKYQ